MEEYKDVKEFFDSVWRAKTAVQRCMWDVTLLQERCEQITVCLDAGRGSGGDPHRDSTLAALADRRSELVQLEGELERKEQQAEDFLERIGDERCRVILKLRYMERLRWPVIRERLEEMQFYYSDRQVFNLHRKGMKEAQQLFWQERDLPREA